MSAAVLKSNQPIHFGGNGGGSSVTLKFSQPGASGSTLYRKPGYNAQFRPINNYPTDIIMGDGPGRRLRKNVANVRRHVDYVSNILNHYETRLWQYGRKQRIVQQPDELYQNTALPAWCTPDVPVDCILTKFVRAAMNKVKCPVYSLCWTPEGKRLITGASTGEFTLWNGTAFNFETILQAHDSAIRAMTWSHNEQWLVSGDHDGYIKYWQPNMNNVHMYQAHKDDPIRGLSFSPTDVKLVSASDDGTARIWDFARYVEERVLRGHGSEVRCVDWHPIKGLVVTGSRDSQQPVKLWDPKSGQCLSTLQDHKSSVMSVQWNANGNWLLTGGRDHLIKLYDIRIMKEMHTFRGHKKEVTSLAWNPVHENLFVSGGGDGSIAYWLVGMEKEVGLLEHAHDQAIWAMQFHPKGHILSTGSNDNNTKFWARNRPGDTQEDIFGLASFTTNMVGALDKEREPKATHIRIDEETILASAAIPGMGLDEDVLENVNRDITTNPVSNASTILLMPEDLNSRKDSNVNNSRKPLLKQPPPRRTQRQFERMWNVSKPGAAGDETPNHGDDVQRQPKASLLGAPPSSMLVNQPGPSMPPPIMTAPSAVGPSSTIMNGRMPAGPPPPGPWATNPPPQLSREAFELPPRATERLGPAFEQQFQNPPPPPIGGMPTPWVANPKATLGQSRIDDQDIDYRATSSGGDVDLRNGPPDRAMYGNVMQEMRAPPHLDLRAMTGPPPNLGHLMGTTLNMGPIGGLPQVNIPQSDNWRNLPNPNQDQGTSGLSPPDPRLNDPRLRRQQEELRDPRRRQPQQNREHAPMRPSSRQDNRNDSWMHKMNTENYGRDDNYGRDPRQNDYGRRDDGNGFGGNDFDDRQRGNMPNYNQQDFNRGGVRRDNEDFDRQRNPRRGRGRPY